MQKRSWDNGREQNTARQEMVQKMTINDMTNLCVRFGEVATADKGTEQPAV
jgi:hypothetical protein